MLALPWPAFLASAKAMPRVRARAALHALHVQSIPNMEKADRLAAIEALKQAAGVGSEGGPVHVRYQDNPAVWEAKGMTREEHEAGRRAALDEWKRRSAEAAAEMAEKRGPKAEA